jgi:hypothetical protein
MAIVMCYRVSYYNWLLDDSSIDSPRIIHDSNAGFLIFQSMNVRLKARDKTVQSYKFQEG